ncbi:MAG TPA: tetratricopeptide repeat protein [Pyrinomonadaceae bacterium]|jgi:tetratricopeptide (TPR) repeat protein
MTRNPKQLIAGFAFMIAGFIAIYVLSNFLESARPPLPENYADQDLAVQGNKLKGFTLGLDGLIADWYWMQSLQYIGGKLVNSETEQINLEDLKPLNPRLLYPLLDNATTLDPHFMTVYSYGAVVLPAIDREQAIKLIEKGIANNPEEWQLYHNLGYIYWRTKDYRKASETYEKGAAVKNAPPFMRLMAARMKTEGGSRETARVIYGQLFEQAPDDQTREIARLRLLQLDSLDEREAVRATLQQFREKNNRCANSWSEIFPLLKSVKLPGGKDFRIDKSNNLVDPTDAPYILDKANCDINLDRAKSKIPPDIK